MKFTYGHFLLKFNHGVETGARLAYMGHYLRTKDPALLRIADDEKRHRAILRRLLRKYKQRPSKIIDTVFSVIGNTVAYLCRISPIFMLNFVASSMELFAIISYLGLAKVYPKHRQLFIEMAKVEDAHRKYFATRETLRKKPALT